MLLKVLTVLSSVIVFCSISNAADRDRDNEISSTFPQPTWADGAYKPHAGFLVGGAQGEGNLDQGAEYGIEVGYQPVIPFGLGLELSSVTASRENDSDLTRTKLLVKTSYNLGGPIPVIKDSYMGLAAGPMLESIGSKDNLYVGLMPNIGFDIPFERKDRDYMSAGFAARYLISSSGNPDVFSLNGTLKYWF